MVGTTQSSNTSPPVRAQLDFRFQNVDIGFVSAFVSVLIFWTNVECWTTVPPQLVHTVRSRPGRSRLEGGFCSTQKEGGSHKISEVRLKTRELGLLYSAGLWRDALLL